MLLDLISNDNYINFNYKLANIIGLHPAIYLSELMNINDKAIRKHKVDDTNSFIIDRKYLKQRTTLEIEEQLEIEEYLSNINIVKKFADNNDNIFLNVNNLIALVSDGENIKKYIKKKQNNVPKETKREAVIRNLKNNIVCNNDELRQAYEDWIDGVYANPKGFLSNASISIFQKTIDDFCNHNLDLALQIISIATVNGYRDATWAIAAYKKNYSVQYRTAYSSTNKDSIAIGTEVF